LYSYLLSFPTRRSSDLFNVQEVLTQALRRDVITVAYVSLTCFFSKKLLYIPKTLFPQYPFICLMIGFVPATLYYSLFKSRKIDSILISCSLASSNLNTISGTFRNRILLPTSVRINPLAFISPVRDASFSSSSPRTDTKILAC